MSYFNTKQRKLPFWKIKTLEQMTPDEWESLCDHCGRCCLLKLEDADTKEVLYTRVVCRLLDLQECRCTHYNERSQLVPSCLVLSPKLVRELKWLPRTCAYRRIAEKRGLDWWHPLVCGDYNIIHELGISVRGKVISESEIDIQNLEDYLDDKMG